MSTETLDEARLRRLIEVGRTLVGDLDLESVLRQVLEAARELTGARYAALGVLDPGRAQLGRFIALGIDETTRKRIGDIPRGRGVLGLLIQDPRPLRLTNVGEHPDSYGFPVGHPVMKSFLGVPIEIGGQAWGNLYLTDKQNGEFDQVDEDSAVTLAAWAAIAIENARLYEGSQQHRHELERAVEGLEATTEIALALGGETDLKRVLELIVKRGRALIAAKSLVILLAGGKHLSVEATAGQVPPNLLDRRIPIEGTLPGEVLRRGMVELVPDVSSRLRLALGDRGDDWADTAILAPLVFRGENLGVIAGFDRTSAGPAFTTEDSHLLQAFAASAATAVATAKSVQEDRVRSSIEASEQERRRWARELHDETLQGLGGLQMLLASALRKGGSAALESAARAAVDHINVEITSLRSLITELRPAALDEIGLEPALESLVQRSAVAYDLKIESELELGLSGARLPAELESTVYRLVQEALTNVSKHASASHVWLSVSRVGEIVEVSVRDDGSGFEPDLASGGFGLVGMRERVTLAGGELEIYSAPGSGASIHATFPIEPDHTRGVAGSAAG
ncbi:MAG: GAF domain-containing sensor histidine kinase [Solirubrobacterales bacterium]